MRPFFGRSKRVTSGQCFVRIFKSVDIPTRPLIDYALTALSTSGAVSEIFVYCTSHAQMIKDHIAASWNRGPVSVSVVTNENCHSFGDAMRDLDAKGVLRYV